jgi:uncharacterized Zn-finger protein
MLESVLTPEQLNNPMLDVIESCDFRETSPIMQTDAALASLAVGDAMLNNFEAGTMTSPDLGASLRGDLSRSNSVSNLGSASQASIGQISTPPTASASTHTSNSSPYSSDNANISDMLHGEL